MPEGNVNAEVAEPPARARRARRAAGPTAQQAAHRDDRDPRGDPARHRRDRDRPERLPGGALGRRERQGVRHLLPPAHRGPDGTQLTANQTLHLQRRQLHRLAAGLRRRRQEPAGPPRAPLHARVQEGLRRLGRDRRACTTRRAPRPALHAGVRGPAGGEGGRAEQGGVARVRPGRRRTAPPARTTCASPSSSPRCCS